MNKMREEYEIILEKGERNKILVLLHERAGEEYAKLLEKILGAKVSKYCDCEPKGSSSEEELVMEDELQAGKCFNCIAKEKEEDEA